MQPALLRIVTGADWNIPTAQGTCELRQVAQHQRAVGGIMNMELKCRRLNGNAWFREHEMKPQSFSAK